MMCSIIKTHSVSTSLLRHTNNILSIFHQHAIDPLYQPTPYVIFTRFTSLDVKKNRYDGQVGSLFIEYRSPVHKFIEATDQNAAECEVRNHDAQVR